MPPSPRPASPSRPAGRRQGWTLMDLVVALSILGVLAAVGAPRVRDGLASLRTQQAAERVRADLRLARQQAIATSSVQTVVFLPDSDRYHLQRPSLDRPSQTYTVDLSAEPYRCRLIDAALGGDATVAFDHFGQPDSGGVVTLESGGRQRTVTIDSGSGLAESP